MDPTTQGQYVLCTDTATTHQFTVHAPTGVDGLILQVCASCGKTYLLELPSEANGQRPRWLEVIHLDLARL